MLRLDSHISPTVAREVHRHRPDCEIIALRDWDNGKFLDEPDGIILDRAMELGFTFVTRDRQTITPLLSAWFFEGHTHHGVVFVDDRTIREEDVGGLVRALVQLWDEERDADWVRRELYLRRPW